MEKKIEDRIELYGEIYQKAFGKALKVNPNNARYIASEIFKEIARDLRSELISKLQRENGKNTESKAENIAEIREEGKINGNGSSPKEKNARPATDKQRYALHKFGIENVPESLTKKEASEILNNLICLSRERDKKSINEMVERLNAMDEWRG
ncbi:hypothetical protein ANME2D_02494 [Candidatus Methanoperedens nitroreducens]|uniref:Uncharacterized protein n=1 Tax=Candidatus Methanoperedens nitratireducens TaxID=1392998 RepID=A0A062V1P4_9EURY|nr:hypothetical protein [Candidatus Methanoperedens nitroreducens]KCZ71292.1 hypothetical protein ANME2D_02494 [Candidatus Methanoperedens nitroreducens]MDJ1420280.1 hypothetical protein [Candidatus Methanoperedens sp.]